VYYIAASGGWVVDVEGTCIAAELKRQFGVRCRLVDIAAAEGLCRQVVHFGTQDAFTSGGFRFVNPSNRVVVTIFHGDPADPDFAPAAEVVRREIGRISNVVVSCRLMQSRMAGWGVPADKTVLIPIGIDTDLFAPPSEAKRAEARSRLGIPDERIVIGSFQKDGVGWGEGMEPKRIKGPDVFLQVVERLSRERPLFVLLTGPSRGYVRQGLDRLGVPYRHAMLSEYREIVSWYHALDLYLVTSREEGGPKAVLESMATGVPLVSTRVGMAADIVEDGVNGFLCDVDDVDGLTAKSLAVLTDDAARQASIDEARQSIEPYDYANVARLYHEALYRPLLESCKST
jgi:glycosyltransferase involved in cell wall biosynthesis